MKFTPSDIDAHVATVQKLRCMVEKFRITSLEKRCYYQYELEVKQNLLNEAWDLIKILDDEERRSVDVRDGGRALSVEKRDQIPAKQKSVQDMSGYNCTFCSRLEELSLTLINFTCFILFDNNFMTICFFVCLQCSRCGECLSSSTA